MNFSNSHMIYEKDVKRLRKVVCRNDYISVEFSVALWCVVESINSNNKLSAKIAYDICKLRLTRYITNERSLIRI